MKVHKTSKISNPEMILAKVAITYPNNHQQPISKAAETKKKEIYAT